MANTIYVNVGGVWKTVTDYYVNVSGYWKTGTAFANNVSGAWKGATAAGPVALPTDAEFLSLDFLLGILPYATADSKNTVNSQTLDLSLIHI